MPSHAEPHGRLAIVGIGPGDPAYMTLRAREAIERAEVVIGNGSYLDQIGTLITGQEVIRSSMGKEVERAREAVRLARDRRVAIVSGGDPGVYGMASIVFEVLEKEENPPAAEVIPGVSAAQAAASLLGSPLAGDHVTISLSDLLTPAEEIERRLGAAFSMGVPVVIYNPRSRGRPDAILQALAIAQTGRAGSTPVGIVRNAFRKDQEVTVTTLGEMGSYVEHIDMHTTVIIGGTESRIAGHDHETRIITPRGYHRKYLY